MASVSILLSTEKFFCSICLDIFSHPVAIPCGHNFCKACITEYWDSNVFCHCPVCEKSFERRPDVFVNNLISEMATQFRKSKVISTISDNLHQDGAKQVEVPCDVCPEAKLKAVKSCLVCLASYCETHLEPHRRTWKMHKLVDPVENLEDRMCKKHHKTLEFFCRNDQACVCVMCFITDHKGHDSVPIEEEYEERKAQLDDKTTDVQQMIQERQQTIQQIKHSVEQNDRAAETELAEVVEFFTVLMASVQRNQAELVEVMELRKSAVEQQAEGFIKEVEQEISELQRKSRELEDLSSTEDHLLLLQRFPSVSTTPRVRDWGGVSINIDLSTGTVRVAVAQLVEMVDKEMEKLSEIELQKILAVVCSGCNSGPRNCASQSPPI